MALHDLLPDSGAHLIFRFSSSGCRMVLLGPVTERAVVELDQGAEYFGVRFRTGQATLLADVHPSELANGYVEVPKIRGVAIDGLAERLSQLPDMKSRQLVMEELVRGGRPLVKDECCRRAALLVEATGGRLPVKDLAVRLGLHVRSLERLLRGQLGMSPKRLSRLVRVRQLLLRLHAGNFGNLAELAFACGYADQAHMVNDFRGLTGHLPGEMEAFRTLPPARAGADRRPLPALVRPRRGTSTG